MAEGDQRTLRGQPVTSLGATQDAAKFLESLFDVQLSPTSFPAIQVQSLL